MGDKSMGGYAFIGGIVLSLVLGVVMPPAAWTMALLAVLGLVVAVMNITDKEVVGYLVANIAVMVGANTFNGMLASLATPLGLGTMAMTLGTVTGNLVFFVAPGAVLIALKEIYAIAKDQ